MLFWEAGRLMGCHHFQLTLVVGICAGHCMMLTPKIPTPLTLRSIVNKINENNTPSRIKVQRFLPDDILPKNKKRDILSTANALRHLSTDGNDKKKRDAKVYPIIRRMNTNSMNKNNRFLADVKKVENKKGRIENNSGFDKSLLSTARTKKLKHDELHNKGTVVENSSFQLKKGKTESIKLKSIYFNNDRSKEKSFHMTATNQNQTENNLLVTKYKYNYIGRYDFNNYFDHASHNISNVNLTHIKYLNNLNPGKTEQNKTTNAKRNIILKISNNETNLIPDEKVSKEQYYDTEIAKLEDPLLELKSQQQFSRLKGPNSDLRINVITDYPFDIYVHNESDYLPWILEHIKIRQEREKKEAETNIFSFNKVVSVISDFFGLSGPDD